MSSELGDLANSVDKEISVSGTAQNAKAGPVLMTGPNDAILLRGIPDWDDETVGKRVTVDAIVRRVPGYPKAEKSDQAMQGTASGGDTWVLEVKQVQVLD